MKHLSQSTLAKGGIVFFLVILALFVANHLASRVIEKSIRKKTDAVGIEIGSFQFNLLRRSVNGQEISYEPVPDSTGQQGHHASVQSVTISGVNLFALLFNHRIDIDHIKLYGVDFLVNKNLRLSPEVHEYPSEEKETIEEIKIRLVEIENTVGRISDDTLEVFAATGSVRLENIHWRDSSNYGVDGIEIVLNNLSAKPKSSLYKLTAHRVYFSSAAGAIEMDSFRLNPLQGKFQFARQLGRQNTRNVLAIPKLLIAGIDYGSLRDSLFHATHLEIDRAALWAFRDKRLPFRNPYKPLPVEMLQQLKFGLLIDTIKVHDSEIVYEEMAEEGIQPGHVDLKHLEAEIIHFTNLPDAQPPYSIMNASCNLMRSGEIQATFRFPLDGKNYTAEGSIRMPDMRELNVMLEPAAFLRMESGRLNKLRFNMEYNEEKSTGNVEVNYENLVLVSLNKKDKQRTVNTFKSLLLKALVKNDKNLETPKSERTGAIDLERDKKRFVTHFWVKSLFNGIGSVVVPSAKPKERTAANR